MNWEAISSIAEILGATAVVVSLLYLAYQLRNQVAESRASALREVSQGFREGGSALLDPQVAGVYARGIEGFENLTDPAERIQFIAVIQRNFRIWEDGYYHNRAGALDSELWDAMERQYAALLSTNGAKDIWTLRKEFFGNDFRDYVESVQPTRYQI